MELGMPWKSIAFYGICLVVFIFSLVEAVYERQILDFMIYVIYAIAGLGSILIGWAMIKAIEKQED